MTKKKDDGLINVQLLAGERLHLRGLLPREGKYVTLDTAERILEKTRLSDKQLDVIEYEEVEGGVRWNLDKDKTAGFNFTTREHALIVRQLEELEETEKLTPALLPLYKKFVVPEKE